MNPTPPEVEKMLITARRVIEFGLNHYRGRLSDRDEQRKREDWNQLMKDEDTYYSTRSDWPREDWARFGHLILRAKLILSASDYLDGKDTELARAISDPRVHTMLEQLEHFAVFGNPNYPIENIVQDIAEGDQAIVGFINEFCKEQFFNFKKLAKERGLDQQTFIALDSQYRAIFDKIGKAIVKYIETNPGTWRKVFGEVEEAYKEIYDSQKDRVKLQEEMEKHLLAQERLQQFETMFEHQSREKEDMARKLAQTERSLMDEQMEKNTIYSQIALLEKEKVNLAQQNDAYMKQWEGVFAQVEVKRKELENRERSLQMKRQEMEHESQALLDDELAKISEMKNGLLQKEQSFASIKRTLENQNTALEERLQKMRSALDSGERGSIVKAAEARALELSFISRIRENVKQLLGTKDKKHQLGQHGVKKFDTMNEMEYDSALEMMDAGISSEMLAAMPANKSVVLVAEKKHRLSANEPRLQIEWGALSHIESYRENGFDNVSVSLSEVLGRLERSMAFGRDEEIIRAFLLASATGFDESTIRYFSGVEAGQGFMHRNVVVFLLNLQEPNSPPIYNRNDSKAALFVDMFKTALDVEYTNACMANILGMLEKTPALTFRDFRREMQYDVMYLREALNELVRRGPVGKDVHKDYDTVYFKRQEA